MKFVNDERAAILKKLASVHYEFPRTRRLERVFTHIVTDYLTRAGIREQGGKRFEAFALLLIGPSRVGKTADLEQLSREFNSAQIVLPDGRTAKMIKVTLSGLVTWKMLGSSTLTELGFPIQVPQNANQDLIWNLVAKHAQEHGVVCIHYDECQHIFKDKSAEAQNILIDSFKSLLKKPSWPLMLIFSGVKELREFIMREEQLRFLVKTVTYDEIDPSSEEDLLELNRLCFAYADRVEVDFTDLSNSDFFRRLAFACSNRWGLVINLLFDALVEAVSAKEASITSAHFCHAFTETQELSPRISPFSINEYEKYFDREAILSAWLRKGKDAL
ncbi:hypothetical protein GCM10007385_02590 [Tateyamaria omphalii]|uniref:AAA family ATPase n=1 Tax=Tateyamaria omphalii TaxID=299262 RepID=UPI00167741B6|nr:AAA family ATPase [Tateyamaria omphalii]GGX39123.1 hypothetical protein GCM10007385_02590 [Tateyamaria omphalii]